MAVKNFRTVHNVVDEIKLKAQYQQGSTNIIIDDDEVLNGVQFDERTATDVFVTDEELERWEQLPQVLNIGSTREIRYKSLKDYADAL